MSDNQPFRTIRADEKRSARVRLASGFHCHRRRDGPDEKPILQCEASTVNRTLSALVPIISREPLSKEERFTLLSNHRRRYVLSYLHRHKTVPVSDLVDQITAWETGADLEALDRNDRTTVYVSLHQTHLPKLADAGVVEYDRDEKTVTLSERGEQLLPYLTQSPDEDVPWDLLFLGLSVLWFVLLLAAWSGLPLFRALPELWLAAGCVATFFGVSLGYAWLTRRSPCGYPNSV